MQYIIVLKHIDSSEEKVGNQETIKIHIPGTQSRRYDDWKYSSK